VILYFLALAFGIHIVLVNLGIGFSTVIPFLKRAGEKSGNKLYLDTSRQLMNFYAAVYALAGVFGTAFTVFLLSFYPAFIGLAGHLTFVPFGLAILAIVIHFFAIIAYWYGWEKWSSGTHFFIGIILLVSAYLIPLGFRAVSAFLNIPAGLELSPKPHLNVAAALLNPTYLPLYIKSITAALAAGFFTIASAYMIKYVKGDREAVEVVKKFASPATITFILAVIFGLIYAETLALYSNYKFVNAFGFLIGVEAQYDFSWIFIIKVVMMILQAAAIYELLKLRKGEEVKGKMIMLAGPAALITVFAGEMLNSFSQYPYFVAKLGEPGFASAIPEPLRTFLAERLNLELANPLASSTDLYLITLLFLVPLLISAAVFLYILLLGKERTLPAET